jgi:Uma2 family endonuclease
MTPQEFDTTPPARFVPGYRYEIINGVLVVSPYPGAGERSPNDELGYWLRQYRETAPGGSVLDDTLPEQTIPAINRRSADRAIWIGLGRGPDELKDVPAIVAEFVSSRKGDALRDYEEKRDEYLAADVQEYWIIDRFRRVMIVYRKGLAAPTYDIVTETQTYQTGLLPGFVLPLARLLEKADQWAPKTKLARQPKAKPPRSKKTHEPNPPAGGTDG